MSTEDLIKIENFPDRIRMLRKSQGLSQQDLADKAGLSVGTVGNWEVGPSKPTGANLKKVAEILKVSPEKLLFGDKGVIREVRSNYMVDESDVAIRQKCRDHFEKFLGNCMDADQIGWFYIELVEKFPLSKFNSSKIAKAHQEAMDHVEGIADQLRGKPGSALPKK